MMNIPADESTLGILDLENLCDDFDSVAFADKLDQTANALVKRQASVSQNLLSSYSGSPELLDLFGTNHENQPQEEGQEASLSSLSASSYPISILGKGLDSKYFIEDVTFDPSSIRYSDTEIDTTEKQKTITNTSKNNILPDLDVPTSLITPWIAEAKENEIIFLPEEMGARSTSVHDKGPFLPGENISWNDFSVDFTEKIDSGFSSSPVTDQFLSDEQALQVILRDEQVFQAEHALDISENHDFDNVSKNHASFETSRAARSLTASNVFGHQSWMLGAGIDRPSFGMVVQSPVRKVDSFLPSACVNSDRPLASDVAYKLCSVPKQKPERRSMRRATCSFGSNPVTTALPTPTNVEMVSSHSESQTMDSCSSSLANSSTKILNQVPSSSDNSFPVSPVPSIASSYHKPNLCNPQNEVFLPSEITTRVQQKSPVNLNNTQKDTGVISQQIVISAPQHPHFSRLDICPPSLASLTVCFGENLDCFIPVTNPFPSSLQCQIVLTGVFNNDRSLHHSRMNQLITWTDGRDIVLPKQKKDVHVSFRSRVPGQLCLTLEALWCEVDCSNISSRTGKCSCLLNCDVVLPKVSVSLSNLKIKYHALSNTAETKSFVLLNQTPAPVTVGLQILLSGGDEGVWSDSELFFAQDHLHKYATNSSHHWLNTASPSVLCVCLSAGTAEAPSRAEIPVSFRKEQLTCLENRSNGFSATVIVSQQSLQPARSLSALRISVVPSPVPLCSSQCTSAVSKSDSVSSGKEVPVIKHKKHVYFLATDINSCRKEDIVLRNCGPSCTLTAYVQEEEEEEEISAFQVQVKDSQPSNTEYFLKKRESLTLTVVFRPSAKTVYQSILHISAITAGSNSSSKILLYGYGGCCKLSLHGCSTTGEALQRPLKCLRFTKGVGEEKQIVILNQGVRPAFVSIAQPSDDISIPTMKFVVLPYSQKVLTLVCSSKSLNESLLIFYGEEHFRQALLKRLPTLKKPSLLSRFDPCGHFKDQDQVPSEFLYSLKDICALGELFFRHVLHFEMLLLYSAVETFDNSSFLEASLSSD